MLFQYEDATEEQIEKVKNYYGIEYELLSENPMKNLLEDIKTYIENKYPQKSHKDHCSYAGLMEYALTGWYGGYGTENYIKEREIENKAREIAYKNSKKIVETIQEIENMYFNC